MSFFNRNQVAINGIWATFSQNNSTFIVLQKKSWKAQKCQLWNQNPKTERHPNALYFIWQMLIPLLKTLLSQTHCTGQANTQTWNIVSDWLWTAFFGHQFKVDGHHPIEYLLDLKYNSKLLKAVFWNLPLSPSQMSINSRLKFSTPWLLVSLPNIPFFTFDDLQIASLYGFNFQAHFDRTAPTFFCWLFAWQNLINWIICSVVYQTFCFNWCSATNR